MDHPCDGCMTQAANHKRLCWRLGRQSPDTTLSYRKAHDTYVSGGADSLRVAFDAGNLQAGHHLRLISTGQCKRIRRKDADEAWAYIWAKRDQWYPKRRRRRGISRSATSGDSPLLTTRGTDKVRAGSKAATGSSAGIVERDKRAAHAPNRAAAAR